MKLHSPIEIYKIRFILLFCSLIGLIILNPIFENLTYGKWFINLSFYFVTLLAIVSLKHNPVKFTIGLILGFLSISSNIFNETQLVWSTNFSQVLFSFLFFSYVAMAIFMSILREKEVTRNIIFAAVCAYLFIGFAFGSLYQLIELYAPHSFDFSSTLDEVQKAFAFQYHYFSFTVLTTVGFGDITPISALAKSLIMIEEFTGVFYMAIFVSRLITAEKRYHMEFGNEKNK